jgi:ribose 5-phosphate isomerase
LRRLPGVVETGLFVARADVVVVAAEDGVRELRKGN